MVADVAQRGGAQQRVHDRVGQRVGVRMSIEPAVGQHGHAPQYQRPSLDQLVDVVASPAAGGHPSVSIRRSRRSNTAISVTPAPPRYSSASS